jgi:hypothetical protein
LKRHVDIPFVAGHAFLQHRGAQGGDAKQGHHQYDDQADDECRPLLSGV